MEFRTDLGHSEDTVYDKDLMGVMGEGRLNKFTPRALAQED